MNDGVQEEPSQDKTGEIQRRKKQVWLITLVMLLTFCIGTLLLLAILWFVFEKIIPQGFV